RPSGPGVRASMRNSSMQRWASASATPRPSTQVYCGPGTVDFSLIPNPLCCQQQRHRNGLIIDMPPDCGAFELHNHAETFSAHAGNTEASRRDAIELRNRHTLLAANTARRRLDFESCPRATGNTT